MTNQTKTPPWLISAINYKRFLSEVLEMPKNLVIVEVAKKVLSEGGPDVCSLVNNVQGVSKNPVSFFCNVKPYRIDTDEDPYYFVDDIANYLEWPKGEVEAFFINAGYSLDDDNWELDVVAEILECKEEDARRGYSEYLNNN